MNPVIGQTIYFVGNASSCIIDPELNIVITDNTPLTILEARIINADLATYVLEINGAIAFLKATECYFRRQAAENALQRRQPHR